MKNKIIDFIPLSEFMALIQEELSDYDSQGFITSSDLIPIIKRHNEKLGIKVHDISQTIIEIRKGKGLVPKDFYKVYYMAGLKMTNSRVTNYTNPWDNSKDLSATYEADYIKGKFSCSTCITVIYKKQAGNIIDSYYTWENISIKDKTKAYPFSPVLKSFNHSVNIIDGEIEADFYNGEIYMMYLKDLISDEGEILVPFNPMITPYYKWYCVEKILNKMIFNSNEDLNKLKFQKQIVQEELRTAWLDCLNYCESKPYLEWLKEQKNKELKWYNTWFKGIM